MTARRTTAKSRRLSGAGLVLAVAAPVTACGGGDGADAGDAEAAPSSAADAAGDVEADPELTAMLPQAIQDAGTLEIGTEALYPPYEYLDEDGQTIIGL